ncbi:hypothetical protein JHU38_09555 [Prevotella sp. A2931]|uniref:Outer membrane protein beta-barrel domain-containing protein n=2 Tax=Prevotellaceae TaxID=171552 RepID=A0ABS3M7B1_9BACT|nr:hypothetical protein [Prevotella illustrans]
MKASLLALALAVSGSVLANHVEKDDTIVVRNPKKVTVVTGDSLQSILIEGSSDNPSYRYSNRIQLVDSNYVSTSAINRDTWDISFGPFKTKKKRKTQFEITSDIALGFCGATDAPEQMDVKPFKSWEIWWTIATYRYRPWRDKHAFSVGIGLDWRNYRIVDNYRFTANEDKVVAIEKYAESANPNFSRVHTVDVTLPLRYEYTDKRFGFSLGPVVNLNTKSSLKTRYRIDGTKHKDTTNNLKTNLVTIDLMGTVTLCNTTFYFKYSPNNIFKKGYGPQFKTFSFGIYL